jgi:hypothetical protein
MFTLVVLDRCRPPPNTSQPITISRMITTTAHTAPEPPPPPLVGGVGGAGEGVVD